MQAVKWLVLAVLSLFLGAFLVLYLSVHPLQMSLYLFLACLAQAISELSNANTSQT